MKVLLGSALERVRSSLFLVPVLFVAAAVGLAEVLLAVDRRWEPSTAVVVPEVTVDSARAVLATVATATIGIAGISFSVALLVIQMASSQYSPRVVHGLFRDPFNRRVMGTALGAFTYCLVVIRSVRDVPGEIPVAPSLSVTVGVVLGLVALLGIVAFINHSAHSMDVSEVLAGVETETIRSVELSWHRDDEGSRDEGRAGGPAGAEPGADVPEGDGHVVRFATNGWIQQVDADALVEVCAPGGTVRLETAVGRYAVAGTPFATVWPPPGDDEADLLERSALAAVRTGRTRTMQQDASYGIRQMVDVALRALSPGVNDPTTAQDAIFHIAAVLREMLCRQGPARERSGPDGRRLLRPEVPDHASVVRLAFDELRDSARSQPAVSIYLLEAIHLLCDSLPDGDRGAAARDALRTQAQLIDLGARDVELLDHDRRRVRDAYVRRFGVPPGA